MPYVELMEIFFIALPILFHAIFGLIIWYQGKSNVLKYGYFRNWMYWMQRISGIVAFVFIITHVWGTRLQVLVNDAVTKDNLFAHLTGQIDNPLTLVWYIVGILASVTHFSNGIWLALITWGITIGPRSQKIASWVCAIIGLILLVLSAQALRGFIIAGA
jgi:succinate dehydrogenase / fumarate reductase cytochrome b subunit